MDESEPIMLMLISILKQHTYMYICENERKTCILWVKYRYMMNGENEKFQVGLVQTLYVHFRHLSKPEKFISVWRIFFFIPTNGHLVWCNMMHCVYCSWFSHW